MSKEREHRELRPVNRKLNYKDLSNSEGSEDNSNSEAESVIFDLNKSLTERQNILAQNVETPLHKESPVVKLTKLITTKSSTDDEKFQNIKPDFDTNNLLFQTPAREISIENPQNQPNTSGTSPSNIASGSGTQQNKNISLTLDEKVLHFFENIIDRDNLKKILFNNTSTHTEMSVQLITLKEILAGIKEYKGEPKDLEAFLNNCDLYEELTLDAQKPVLLQVIKAKLSGEVLQKLGPVGNFATWALLKVGLRNAIKPLVSFAGAQEAILNNKQMKSEGVRAYGARMKQLLDDINNTQHILGATEAVKLALRAQNEKQTIIKFEQNLINPELQRMSSASHKQTLDEAISYASEKELWIISSTLLKCSLCHKSHLEYDCKEDEAKAGTSASASVNKASENKKKAVVCFKCNKPGHLANVCRSQGSNSSNKQNNNNAFKKNGNKNWNTNNNQNSQTSGNAFGSSGYKGNNFDPNYKNNYNGHNNSNNKSNKNKNNNGQNRNFGQQQQFSQNVGNPIYYNPNQSAHYAICAPTTAQTQQGTQAMQLIPVQSLNGPLLN